MLHVIVQKYIMKYIMNYITSSLYMQVNDLGIISFSRPLSSSESLTSPLFPLNGTKQIVAPYWTNANIIGIGNIFYRQTTNASLLARVTDEIHTAFPTSQNVVITSLLIATWFRVCSYNYMYTVV